MDPAFRAIVFHRPNCGPITSQKIFLAYHPSVEPENSTVNRIQRPRPMSTGPPQKPFFPLPSPNAPRLQPVVESCACVSSWGRGPFCKRVPRRQLPQEPTFLPGNPGECSSPRSTPPALLGALGGFVLCGGRRGLCPSAPPPFEKGGRKLSLPILPLKVLERWGPGGGNPFSKGFPPPQKPRSSRKEPRAPTPAPGACRSAPHT